MRSNYTVFEAEIMKSTFLTKEIMSTLSPLEAEILSLFSPNQEFRVKEIYDEIKKKRKVASSSVPVILDRLHNKGLVERKTETCRGGVRYVYSLKKNKVEFEKSLMEATVNKLIEKFGQSALSYFNERFPEKKKVK